MPQARACRYEIAAIEAGENVILQPNQESAPIGGILNKLGSSHLEEIGRGSTPAIRRKVWDRSLDGKINLTPQRLSR